MPTKHDSSMRIQDRSENKDSLLAVNVDGCEVAFSQNAENGALVDACVNNITVLTASSIEEAIDRLKEMGLRRIAGEK